MNFLVRWLIRVKLWIKWDKVFMSGPSKICGRQPLKNLKDYGLLKQTISLQTFKRLSSTNFTWSTIEYFVPNGIPWLHRWKPSRLWCVFYIHLVYKFK